MMIQSYAIIPLVGTFCKILFKWFNFIEEHNVDTFRRLISKRNPNTPLITVANHYSCMDDPFLWSVLHWKDLWSPHTMRWSLAAHDICFTNAFYSWFFSAGKCISVTRGNGVYQNAVNFCLQKLERGQWVHIFPEGKVNMSLEYLRLKWGIGRMVFDCSVSPLVLLIYHIGMDKVLPNKRPYIPRIGKKVTVVVGEPMDFSDMVKDMRLRNEDPVFARKLITDIIQENLWILREKAEVIHNKRFTVH